jgi:quercetin dioxygenase-like cupin family protein
MKSDIDPKALALSPGARGIVGRPPMRAREAKTMSMQRTTRPLAGSLLRCDFATELERLRQEYPWREHGSNAVTLVKHPDLRVVLMALKAGARIQEHKAAGRISIQTLSGRLRLHLPDEVVDLPTGHLLTLDRGVPHDIEALDESDLLLTIAWQEAVG